MNQDKVSKMIKELRQKNGLTQRDFANMFNVSYQAVSKWERGINYPDISILKEICEKFNISIDEFLDTKVKKNNNYLILIIIISIITIILLSFGYYFLNKRDFEHKMITSNCKDFTVSGSIAYNKEKASIYISNINYCGNEHNIIYDQIDCNLYEDDGKTKILIESCDKEDNISISDYVRRINFSIDNYNKICKEYKESSLYLEINANKDNSIKAYKIPLKLSSSCIVD